MLNPGRVHSHAPGVYCTFIFIMARINILTDETIAKIAAGEVIERPASVVKELVENSIDAGADSVDIEVEASGRSLIRVADNGHGMEAEDLKLAFRRHATSKIADASDLDRIASLGFRGEALGSIAAVSQVDVMTADGRDDKGVYAYLESGEVLKTRPVGRARGTTIEVRNLFYNVPARKKFLKADSTELAEIVNTVGRFIVSYPGVEFRLTHNERCLLHALKNAGLIERVRLVLGADVSEKMLEFGSSVEGISVSGCVSSPANSRKDRRAQMFFVNGRFVRSKVIGDAVFEAYRSMLERGRYPAAVIFLEVPSDGIDVNVHPTKLEVKFDDDKRVKKAVTGAISGQFRAIREARTIGRADAAGDQGTVHPDPALTLEPEVQNEFSYDTREAAPAFGKSSVPGTDTGEQAPVREEPSGGGWGDMPAPGAEHIFQIGGCYIVQFADNGMLVADQHAAHERVLYEYFTQRNKGKQPESQSLLFPAHMDLSAGESVVMEKMLEAFRALGFGIEPFGDRSYIVQSVPPILGDSDIKTVIYDILSDLMSQNLAKLDPVDELAKIAACRAAIKAGDELNEEEMHMLLEQLGECDLPFTCPHGRPTITEITLDELEKRFHRK